MCQWILKVTPIHSSRGQKRLLGSQSELQARPGCSSGGASFTTIVSTVKTTTLWFSAASPPPSLAAPHSLTFLQVSFLDLFDLLLLDLILSLRPLL